MQWGYDVIVITNDVVLNVVIMMDMRYVNAIVFEPIAMKFISVGHFIVRT